ncbi:MAG TPA: hypothetical protein VHX90_03285 [Verrucomicrobiae bacterium]|jgi:hypothetical protein|nr:hypothetical protein [Verrucomicrobiae bacterium]
MKMTKILKASSLSLIVLYAISLRAQPSAPTAVQQLQNFQQNTEQQQPIIGLRAGGNAPETYTNENTDIGEQHILRVIPRPTMWEVVLDSRAFYTDNSTLSQRTANNPLTSSSVFVNTVSAAFAPTPYRLGVGRFAPTIGISDQWWNYEGGPTPAGPVSKNDFNAQTAFVGAKYLLPENWMLFGNFNYTRIVQQPYYSVEFYHEFVPSAGVQKLFQISQNSLVSASLQTDYHFGSVIQPFTATDSQDHWDGTFSIAYSWQPAPKVVVQPYYSLTYAYYKFDTAGHNEILNTFGFSVAYYFTRWLSLQAFDNYDFKSSDDTTGSNQGYRAFDFGLDLTATFRF